MKYEIAAVVGARPNYMKVAPIWRVFFEDLRLPKPDVYLGVGSGPHGEQTGKVMQELERVLTGQRPDLLLVVGDVNSTMAGALVAVKMGVPVAHVEAGLRSFDRTMPEEINRMVTDIIADLLFTTEPSAETNLLREGVEKSKIHFVGNVMIDSLRYYGPFAEGSWILDELGLKPRGYGLVTLHRPSNVDEPGMLGRILSALVEMGARCPLVFPAHPRTQKIMRQNRFQVPTGRLRILDPVGYLDFVKLMTHARLVLTDSGGIQEETTVLGVPCLTIRQNTERPITIEIGTNRLVGVTPERIIEEGRKVLEEPQRPGRVPELWDGKASERIVSVIDEYFR